MLPYSHSADLIASIQRDPCASYWIKRALKELSERDCLDALNDCRELVSVFKKVCDEQLGGSRV